jgi:hypothetical protein
MFPLCSYTQNEGPGVQEPAEAVLNDSAALEALEREVDEAIAICVGEVRAALRAALVANAFLTAEVEHLTQAASFGFKRGRSAARRASEKLDDWRCRPANKADLVAGGDANRRHVPQRTQRARERRLR